MGRKQKVVNYIKSASDNRAVGAILLAPTDMVAWAKTDSQNDKYMELAEKLIAEGKPEALVGAQCWEER